MSLVAISVNNLQIKKITEKMWANLVLINTFLLYLCV